LRISPRPKQDSDFEAEEEYRFDYISFQKAWVDFANSSDNSDKEWAVFIRHDVVIHPSLRKNYNTSRNLGQWMEKLLSDLFYLAEDDGFAWLGLCGHVLDENVQPPDADVLLNR
jgi:hypothetical protein